MQDDKENKEGKSEVISTWDTEKQYKIYQHNKTKQCNVINTSFFNLKYENSVVKYLNQ